MHTWGKNSQKHKTLVEGEKKSCETLQVTIFLWELCLVLPPEVTFDIAPVVYIDDFSGFAWASRVIQLDIIIDLNKATSYVLYVRNAT